MGPGEHSCFTEMKASTSYGRWNFSVACASRSCTTWSSQKKVKRHPPTQKKGQVRSPNWSSVWTTERCHENSDPEKSDLRPQSPKTRTPKTQTSKTQTPKTRTPRILLKNIYIFFKKKIYIVNSSQFLSPDVFPRYPIDGIDNRWQSISIDSNQYQLIDWYW